MEARRASLLGSMVTTSAYGHFLTSKLVANLTMLAPGPPLDSDWLVSALSRDTRRYPLRPSETVELTPSYETDNGTSALRSRNRRTCPLY